MQDSLGDFFKSMRLARGDSIKLVSEATELKHDYLKQIEADEAVPDVDALAVLVSYYEVDEDVAEAIHAMISKTKEPTMSQSDTNEPSEKNEGKSKKMQINLSADMRIMYTDMVQVSETEMGVVLNFIQTAPGNVGTVVSRIGMSHAQADALRELMNKNLT